MIFMISPKYIEKFLEQKLNKNMNIAVGTSNTAHKVIKELAIKNVLKDLNIKIIPTSTEIAHLAKEYYLEIAKPKKIDLIIEFADSIDSLYNYTKNNTQSLIRDKIIAYYAKEVIVFVKKENIKKKISNFPVEIAKFCYEKTISALQSFGQAQLRPDVKTINQNYIVDLKLENIYNYEELEYKLKEIPGVLETGLFINLADKIYSVDKKIEKLVDFTKQ